MNRRIDDKRVAQMTRNQQSAAEIAAILGFSERTVLRARHRTHVAQPGPEYLTDDEKARIRVLAEQEVPVLWIADDIGRSPEAVHRVIGNRPEISKKWLSVWPEILHNRALLELHREFAPRRTKVAA